MISLNLQMDKRKGERYKSKSQKIRAITETWAESNMFCPYCGNQYIYIILRITDRSLIFSLCITIKIMKITKFILTFLRIMLV